MSTTYYITTPAGSPESRILWRAWMAWPGTPGEKILTSDLDLDSQAPKFGSVLPAALEVYAEINQDRGGWVDDSATVLEHWTLDEVA